MRILLHTVDRERRLSVRMLLHFIISVVLLTTVHGEEKKYSELQSKLYSDLIICDHNRSLYLDVSETMIYFYDFQNNLNASYKINDAFDGLTSLNLNVTRKIILYIMGYEANITWSLSDTVRNTFRNVPNIYLVMVAYPALMFKGGKPKHFENSIMHSYYVGEALGKLLTELHVTGIPSRNIHCIGSSLGAQILGYVGDIYTKQTGEKIWRITGIDPAGPCFSNSGVENQLRSGLADYVEVYHCNAGLLGTSSILADIDVFLNNEGLTQPKCHVAPDFGEYESAQCSHRSCFTYWARTVEHSSWYRGLACDSYNNYIEGKCAGNEVTTVGYFNPGTSTGVFYATTEIYGPMQD